MEKETYKTIKSDAYKIDPHNIVVVDGFNSRCVFEVDELAAQIKEQGVLNPISVVPFTDENGVEKYKLVDGERRYRAVMKLIEEGVEIARIPAIFLPKTTSLEDLYVQQAMRNEGRVFNEYEWGLLAIKLRDKCGLSTQEIAHKLGKDDGVVGYWFKIQEMDERLRNLVRDNLLCGSDLRRVLQAHGWDEQSALEELETLKPRKEKDGTMRMHLKDLDKASRTIRFKDSANIRRCIAKMIEYTNINAKNYKYGDLSFISVDELYTRLCNDELIDDILTDMYNRRLAKAS